MKQNEIQKCVICGQGIMHNRNITFYRISIERMFVDIKAVQRQHGLEMMLGGLSAGIANILGPDEDMAKSLGKPDIAFVCESCAIESSLPLAEINERIKETNHDLKQS